MSDRFQVEQPHGLASPWRWGLVLAVAGMAGLAKVAIHLNPNLHWETPTAWSPVLVAAGKYLALAVAIILPSGWSDLASVEIEAADIVVHRAIEQIPLLGRWFGPRRFPRSEWRLASTDRGLLVGKPSQDPEFRWSAERIFRCPETAKPALKTWLTQLG